MGVPKPPPVGVSDPLPIWIPEHQPMGSPSLHLWVSHILHSWGSPKLRLRGSHIPHPWGPHPGTPVQLSGGVPSPCPLSPQPRDILPGVPQPHPAPGAPCGAGDSSGSLQKGLRQRGSSGPAPPPMSCRPHNVPSSPPWQSAIPRSLLGGHSRGLSLSSMPPTPCPAPSTRSCSRGSRPHRPSRRDTPVPPTPARPCPQPTGDTGTPDRLLLVPPLVLPRSGSVPNTRRAKGTFAPALSPRAQPRACPDSRRAKDPAGHQGPLGIPGSRGTGPGWVGVGSIRTGSCAGALPRLPQPLLDCCQQPSPLPRASFTPHGHGTPRSGFSYDGADGSEGPAGGGDT